ncbi:hypothetical protein DL771_004492 [Monosporascus sp. 5C6A]|nr:hypothetical protein DL771_004492 [Monosporascus sp. 5C6A]
MAIIQSLIDISDGLYRSFDPFHGAPDSFDDIYSKVVEFKAQVEILKRLWDVVVLLRQHPYNALPNQRATRVKHFILFVFGISAPGRFRRGFYDKNGTNTLSPLRELGYCGLMLLALAYTFGELANLDSETTKYLLPVTRRLTSCHEFSNLLLRDDVDKAVLGLITTPPDEARGHLSFNVPQSSSSKLSDAPGHPSAPRGVAMMQRLPRESSTGLSSASLGFRP